MNKNIKIKGKSLLPPIYSVECGVWWTSHAKCIQHREQICALAKDKDTMRTTWWKGPGRCVRVRVRFNISRKTWGYSCRQATLVESKLQTKIISLAMKCFVPKPKTMLSKSTNSKDVRQHFWSVDICFSFLGHKSPSLLYFAWASYHLEETK